jgi:hypothetical protein
MPLFQDKLLIANAILQNSVLPFVTTLPRNCAMTPELLRKKENEYIERCIEKELSISRIAQLIDFSEEEVLLRIKEIKPVFQA